jgi:flagellar basal-body rod protein FlgC
MRFCMSSVSAIAASGMAAATMRLQMSANKVANAANPNVDLASEIVQQLMARVSFAANAQVMRADSKMMASLLDITA